MVMSNITIAEYQSLSEMKHHRWPGKAKLSSLWKLSLHTMSIIAELVCTCYHTFQLRLELNQLKECGQRRRPIWQTRPLLGTSTSGRALCLPDNEQEAPPGPPPSFLDELANNFVEATELTKQIIGENWIFSMAIWIWICRFPGISVPIGHRSGACSSQTNYHLQ